MHSDNPEHGFQFPGTFELCAMGAADAGLELSLPEALEQAGLEVLREAVIVRPSSAGKYASVRVQFRAGNREQYDAAHAVLRAHPGVKWTI